MSGFDYWTMYVLAGTITFGAGYLLGWARNHPDNWT